MSQTNETMEIRPVWFIRWLALLLTFVVIGPSALGCIYLAFHWSELIANLPGASLCIVIASVGTFFSYRWMTISGCINQSDIILRGWFTTCHVQPDQLSEVRKEHYRKTSTVDGTSRSQTVWWYSLYDHNGQMIGRVPDSLLLCRDWDKFLQRLYSIARKSNSSSHSKRIPLGDLPVEQWTSEDFERYEREEA